MLKQEAYKILDISPPYKIKDVKKTYRKLSMLYHPDRGGDVVSFLKVKDAYDLLVKECFNQMEITHDMGCIFQVKKI